MGKHRKPGWLDRPFTKLEYVMLSAIVILSITVFIYSIR